MKSALEINVSATVTAIHSSPIPYVREGPEEGRARTIGAKAFSFTHRTKVFADGIVWKNNT